MVENRKGYEHERYRIDKIEKFIGADRDAARSTTTSISRSSTCTRTRAHRPAATTQTTLLAMLKRAKAERVIKSHQLSDMILPPAPRNGDPQPWTFTSAA